MGRKTKVALTVGAAGVAAWAASKAVVKPSPRDGKKALDFKKPVILAHRGGLSEAPEHTAVAFSKSAALGINGFAIDIRLTKDEEIVVFHDESLERTTDLSGKISDQTFNDLKKADAGYQFTDALGNHPYRGKGETILSLRELLEMYPHLFIVINMKDSPDTYEGSLMPSKLWRLLEELGVEDCVAVTSIYDEQIDRFNLYAQNRVAIGAGDLEMKKAFAAYTSKFGHLYNPQTDFFRIPAKFGLFSLGLEGFMKYLNQLNIPVYIEGIEETDSCIKLLNAGASGFVTDHPTSLMEIIQDRIER